MLYTTKKEVATLHARVVKNPNLSPTRKHGISLVVLLYTWHSKIICDLALGLKTA